MTALTIARRELEGFFYAPVAYAVGTLFLLLQGITFYLFALVLSSPQAGPGAVFSYFFGGTLLFWVSLLFLAAVVPMRLLAEERRNGTIEPLLTAPVSDLEVVLGKYLGALGFFVALWLPTLVYVALVRGLGGPIEAGPIASGYLGTFLEGAAFLALGTLASALTRNQIVAAVLSFVLGFGLLLVGILSVYVKGASPTLSHVLEFLSPFRQMQDFSRGIVDSRHVVFLVSVVVISLFGAVRALEARRWT